MNYDQWLLSSVGGPDDDNGVDEDDGTDESEEHHDICFCVECMG